MKTAMVSATDHCTVQPKILRICSVYDEDQMGTDFVSGKAGSTACYLITGFEDGIPWEPCQSFPQFEDAALVSNRGKLFRDLHSKLVPSLTLTKIVKIRALTHIALHY